MSTMPNTAPNAANIQSARVAQAVPSRTLTRWHTPRGEMQAKDLESVRDLLRTRRARQEPIDHSRSPSQVHLRFGDGKRATVAFMEPNGLGTPMILTNHALRALGREVLPGRGLDFLLEELELGEGGRKLADMNFAAFSRGKHDPRMFRTVVINDNGNTVRALRSIHSTDYAPYDNLEFVEDLLSGGYASHPLVSVVETDQALRFRFLLEKPTEVSVPVPMVEAWNSEVGSRAVTVKPGMFRLVCTNGAGAWEDVKTFRWIHRGDRSRIQIGVKDALTEVRTTASGTVDAYKRALDIGIDDAYAWFEAASSGEEIGKAEKEAVKGALHDPTTTPGGRLASVVDAVTLIAQNASDEFEQERIENVGTRLLRRGLAESLRVGSTLHALS